MPRPEPLPGDPHDLSWIVPVFAASRDYALVRVDLQGVITAWTGAAENVFGHTADEAVGRPFAMLYTPEDIDARLHVQELDVARASGRSEDDRWHLRKGGLRFWGSGVLHALHDAAGAVAGYCKIVRDRTDLRTRLDGLLQRVDEQAQALEERRRFMARLGHELRNPLAPIRAAAYTIQRIGDEKVRRPCEVLDRQVEVMVRLLDDLAEATRADVRVASLLPQQVVLQEAARLAASGLEATMASKHQRLDIVLPEVPIVFEADPARLQQMLLNLLGNAVKYTPDGGHVTLTATIENDSVVINVEDDGIGIPDELLPHLFELFARGREAARLEEGTGVGLAVVKELATLHGGSIAVRSGAERGSVFTLRLPLVQPAPAPGDPLLFAGG